MPFLIVLAVALLAPDPARALPVAAAIVAAVGITGTAATIASAVLTLAVSIGLSLVAQLLAPKPKKNFNNNLDQGLTVTQRDATSPRRIVYGQCRLGGTIVFMTTGPNTNFLTYVVALCEGPVESFVAWYLNDQAVTLNPSTNAVQEAPWTVGSLTYVAMKGHLGSATQAADASITAANANWTTSHRLLGIAYFWMRMVWDQTTFQQGVPNPTVVVKGRNDIYDPRDGSTGWTANAALCIRHYLTLPYAKGGCGFSTDEIDDTNFSAQANICDETISLAGGGTEPRYEIHGVLQLGEDDTPQDRLNAMLAACAGKLVFAGGKWKLYVGAWRSTDFVLTADMLTAGVTVQTRQSRREQFNAVKGKYRQGGANKFIPTDFPAVTSAVFEEEDGGERVYKDIALEFTKSASMAQRLARIVLRQSREPIEVEVKCNLLAYEVTVGDVIGFTFDRYGWNEKPFEVTSWEWTVEDTDGVPTLGIKMTLRETSAAVYDWAVSDEALLADEPATNLPDFQFVGAPTALAVTESLYQTSGSAGVKSQATLTWQEPDFAFAAGYEVQYKASASSTWLALPATTGAAAVLPDIAPGTYNLRVRTISALGGRSDWATQTYEVLGLKAPPSSPTTVRSTVMGGNVTLTWDRSPDLDVRIGGQTLIRFSPVSSAPTWDQTTSATDPLPGDATTCTLPARTGYYLVRFKDSSGTLSPSYVSVSAEQSSLAALTTLTTVTEDPTFSGTKTNCTAAGSLLTLNSGSSSGTYAFAGSMDFGSVKSARITGHLKGYSGSVGPNIDSITTLIDTWSDFDGGSTGGDADAYIEHRRSNDNSNWTAWTRLDAVEASCRYVQFRVQMSTADTAYQMVISELRAKAEAI